MADAKKELKKLAKVPNKLGFNTPTLGLGLFVFAVGIAGSFALNRFDNRVTRDLNSIKAGQAPGGI
jgi:hypothetical protein